MCALLHYMKDLYWLELLCFGWCRPCMVLRLSKDRFSLFHRMIILQLCFKHQSNTMHAFLKINLVYHISWDRGCFMKNLGYLQYYPGTTRTAKNKLCLWFIDKAAVIIDCCQNVWVLMGNRFRPVSNSCLLYPY